MEKNVGIMRANYSRDLLVQNSLFLKLHFEYMDINCGLFFFVAIVFTLQNFIMKYLTFRKMNKEKKSLNLLMENDNQK